MPAVAKRNPTVDRGLVETLRRDGIVEIDEEMNFIDSFVAHLSACPVYENHVRQGRPPAGPIGSHPWMCHDMWDVVAAPDFFEIAVDFIPVAAEYLEAPPLLYSMNTFYTEPTPKPKWDIQDFHRDADDERFLVMFMYCTDVCTKEDGAHQYKVGTRRGGEWTEETRTILGPRGTIFLEDTTGYHCGLVPQHRRRMIAWARWGISDPPVSYGWDKLQPMPKANLGDRYPSDPEIQRAVKLIVA